MKTKKILLSFLCFFILFGFTNGSIFAASDNILKQGVQTINGKNTVSTKASSEESKSIEVNTTYTDNLSEFSETDSFTFKLDKPGVVTVSFSHEYEGSDDWYYWNMSCYKINEPYDVIFQMDYLGKNTETVTNQKNGLPEGNYVLYIKKYNSDHYSDKEYQFRVNYTPANDWEREINNSIDTANPIAVNSDVNGTISATNNLDKDYFKFNLSKTDTPIIYFSHEYYDDDWYGWIVSLYDSDKKLIRFENNETSIWYKCQESNAVGDILGNLSAGTYYLEVSFYNNYHCPDVPYKFRIQTESLISPDKPDNPVTGIDLGESFVLHVDETKQLSAKITPDNASNKNINWSSDNKDIASVDNNGLVKGIKPGSTYIRAKTEEGDVSDTVNVRVIDKNLETLENNPEKNIPGKNDYSTNNHTTFEDGTHINSLIIVNNGDSVDSSGELFIDSGGELVVDGTAYLKDVKIRSGGKLTVRNKGKVKADSITLEDGLMSSSILELQSKSTLIIQNDLAFNNTSQLNMFGGTLAIKGSLNFLTKSKDSRIEDGDIFIGDKFVVNKNNSFKATANNSIVFYKKSYEKSPIDNNNHDFTFGNVYVQNKEAGKKLNLEKKNVNGIFSVAIIKTGDDDVWTCRPQEHGKLNFENDQVNYEININQLYSDIVDQNGAYLLQDPSHDFTDEQAKALTAFAQSWVTTLKMPIYDDIRDIGAKVFCAKISMKITDKNDKNKEKKQYGYIYCDAIAHGNFSKFYRVYLVINNKKYDIGFGAKADTDKFAEQAGEYLRDECLEEYLNLCDEAISPTLGLSELKRKVTFGTVKTLLKKYLCPKAVTDSDESIRDLYNAQKKKIKDFITLIDCEPRELSEITGLLSSKAVSSEQGNGPIKNTETVSVKKTNQKAPIAAVPTLSIKKALDQPVEVKDEKLAKSLSDILGKSTNGDLDYSKAAEITELDLSDTPIQDLTGIENFVNLQTLNLKNTEVEDLGPLEGLDNLVDLNISQTIVSDLEPISKLTKLKTLIASENLISNITPLEDLTNLTEIDLSNNLITSLSSLEPLEALTSVIVSSNPLDKKEIASLSDKESLENLEISDCGLEDMSALNCKNLKSLNLSYNKLSDLEALKNLNSLVNLNASNNELGDISALKNLESLTDLNLADNLGIKDLSPVNTLKNLNNLNLSNDFITDSDLENLKDLEKLETLDISYNPVATVTSILSIPSLKKVDITETPLDKEEAGILEEEGLEVIYQKSLSKPASLYFLEDQITLDPGMEIKQDVNSYPVESDLSDIKWSSNNPDVASVNQANGIVTSKKGGMALITASAGDVQTSYTVSVTDKTTGSQEDEGSTENPGQPGSDKPEDNPQEKPPSSQEDPGNPQNPGNPEEPEEPTNPDKPQNPETSEPKEPINPGEGNEPVAVKAIKLNKTNLNLKVNEIAKLTVSFDPENTTQNRVIWSTSDNKIAQVNSGTVIGVAKGTAEITVRSYYDSNIKAVCKVTVEDPTKPDEDDTNNNNLNNNHIIDPGAGTDTNNGLNDFTSNNSLGSLGALRLDKSVIYLTTLPNGITSTSITAVNPNSNTPVSWSVSPASVATITGNGNQATIKAIAEGEAVITAAAGNQKATAKVIVSNNEFTTDEIEIFTNDLDYFTVIAKNLRANPALNLYTEPQKVSIFAWSDNNQKDINAKVAQRNGNDWYYIIPVNDTPVNNYFNDANNIKVHVYASGGENYPESFIGAAQYSWTDPLAYDKATNAVYIAYSQDKGFIHSTSGDASTAGTTGEARQMEGMRISSNVDNVKISTSVHASDLGWLDPVEDGVYAGTMGQNRQIEAVKLVLSGPDSSKYYLRYRVHVKDLGWLPWVSTSNTDQNEVYSGTVGQNRRMEAIEVVLLPK